MADVLHLGDEVEFVTNTFETEGAPLGSIGVVVDDWADGSNDVEISNPENGEVVARVRAGVDDLRLYSKPFTIEEPREHGVLFGRGDDLGAPAGDPPSPPGTQFGGIPGGNGRPWFGGDAPPEGELEGDIPWELRDEPPSGPIFH